MQVQITPSVTNWNELAKTLTTEQANKLEYQLSSYGLYICEDCGLIFSDYCAGGYSEAFGGGLCGSCWVKAEYGEG